jgi:hypothetical protein
LDGVIIQPENIASSHGDGAHTEPPIAPGIDESLRAELLNEVEISQAGLEHELEALRHADTAHLDHDVIAQGGVKLQRLNALRDQLVGGAKGVPLTALRASVASAIADTRAYASGIGAAASAMQSAATAQAVALAQSSEAAHAVTGSFMDDYYRRRIFDPYLKFTSTEDEEAYRRREAERQRLIENARAENTPQSNLRAVQLSIEQLKDAGVHGADRSPDYKPMLDQLDTRSRALQQQLDKQTNKESAAVGSANTATAPDPYAALRAAGVSLADNNDPSHRVPTQERPSLGRAQG